MVDADQRIAAWPFDSGVVPQAAIRPDNMTKGLQPLRQKRTIAKGASLPEPSRYEQTVFTHSEKKESGPRLSSLFRAQFSGCLHSAQVLRPFHKFGLAR